MCLLLVFLVTKRLAFKSSLDCTFIPWLLSSFNLSSYSWESVKRNTQRLLLRCPEIGGDVKIGLPVGVQKTYGGRFCLGGWRLQGNYCLNQFELFICKSQILNFLQPKHLATYFITFSTKITFFHMCSYKNSWFLDARH